PRRGPRDRRLHPPDRFRAGRGHRVREAPLAAAMSRTEPRWSIAAFAAANGITSGRCAGTLDGMTDEIRMLPTAYHEAVLHWQRHNFPEYPLLAKRWEQYFPKDAEFCLCARLEQGMPDTIQVGDLTGQPKAVVPKELHAEAAEQLLAIIR